MRALALAPRAPALRQKEQSVVVDVVTSVTLAGAKHGEVTGFPVLVQLVSEPSSETPETASCVKEQRSRAALLLVVPWCATNVEGGWM
jgi:hypothetical protein